MAAASGPEPVDSAGAAGIAGCDATALVVTEVTGTAEVADPAGTGTAPCALRSPPKKWDRRAFHPAVPDL